MMVLSDDVDTMTVFPFVEVYIPMTWVVVALHITQGTEHTTDMTSYGYTSPLLIFCGGPVSFHLNYRFLDNGTLSCWHDNHFKQGFSHQKGQKALT
jgi:hypothetical protein